MRIGFATADITPPPGGHIGSINRRPMTGVHDPLLAVACALDDGSTPVALVGVDSGCVMRQTVTNTRQQIQRATGIRADHVLVSASHTHQGGPALATFNAVADPAYAAQVSDGIVQAVASAWQNRQEAQIGFGAGRAPGISFNRRFLMRDGTHATHPGKLHPDIVRPAGPVDDRVNVLAVQTSDRKFLGVIVNFGCHCTVTEAGDTYSADYVHYLREHLKPWVGDVPVVFLLGACGDVTQIDQMQPFHEQGHHWADMMGATLAAETARTIAAMTFNPDLQLRAATETVSIPVRPDDSRSQPTLGLGSGSGWAEIFEREKPHIEKLRRETPIIDCEIQAISIGNLALVANGAELFVEPSLEIQSLSPRNPTWVVTLANEYLGYVPTPNAYYAGGYEPQTARSSYLAPNAAQLIVQASLRALKKL